MHIVSNVEGRMRKDCDPLDALAAGFPAGTVSGAPKVRAMQIIDELEKEKRALYAGCVGYFSAGAEMDTCIVLRTALVKDGVMYVQAGAGIVADSDPDFEQQECINKAKALFRAAPPHPPRGAEEAKRGFAAQMEDAMNRHGILGISIAAALGFALATMAVITARADLPKFASGSRSTGTPDENKAVVRGTIAYFGTYSVDEKDKTLTLNIDGSTFPNWTGTSQTRSVTLADGVLTQFLPIGSGGGTVVVKFQRVK
jgi:hypothetical protein